MLEGKMKINIDEKGTGKQEHKSDKNQHINFEESSVFFGFVVF